jgi:hypothetical protein
VGAALATPALAANSGPQINAMAAPRGGGVIFGPVTPIITLQRSYDLRMLRLKAKMQRLTAQDGGELSTAHEASLQKELDGVNRFYGLKPAHG